MIEKRVVLFFKIFSISKEANVLFRKGESNLSLYSQYYAEECDKFAGSISALLRLQSNTAHFEEMSQRW